MKHLMLSFLLLVSCFATAQIEVNKSSHDFGAIERGTDRVVDFTFTNTGSEKAFLLRSAFPREFSHLFSGREMMPDSSITLRVKYNPFRKENVDYEIPVYFSSMDKPVELSFKGQVNYIDPANNPACPSFNEKAPQAGSQFEVEFVVLDKNSGEPLQDAKVRIIERGREVKSFTTNREGKVIEVMPIRYFYLLAEADGYHPADSSTWVNRRNNYFEFELEPRVREEIEMTAEESRSAGQVETERDEKPQSAVVVPQSAEEKPEVSEDDFSTDRYVHNNLVFLVDVSSSMNRSGRLDIMKAALLDLVDMLRDVDQLTIITYAANTEIILEPTFVEDKGEIRKMVRNISAEGFTAGSKAVQTAYSLAEDHFIAGGNNQVLLVSDGVFRSSDTRRIQSSVEHYIEKQIFLSIIGLKSHPDHAEELGRFAGMGGGLFIPIDHFDQAGYMITEAIRRQSRVN